MSEGTTPAPKPKDTGELFALKMVLTMFKPSFFSVPFNPWSPWSFLPLHSHGSFRGRLLGATPPVPAPQAAIAPARTLPSIARQA